MDIAATIIPKSDQLNAEDLLTGPMTVTVESVSKGNAEQPVDIHLVETPGRAYRPSKTMRRVIVKAWGSETDAYTGRRMTLYRDPDVKFGGVKVGGIKVSHLSHIDRAFSLALTETRGKRALHEVKPLTDAPAPKPAKTPAPDIAAITDVDTLRGMWQASDATTRRAIEARVAELTKPVDEPEPADTLDSWAGES